MSFVGSTLVAGGDVQDRPPPVAPVPPFAPVPPYVANLLMRVISRAEWRTHEIQLDRTNPDLARQLRQTRDQLEYSAWWWRDQVKRRTAGFAVPLSGSAEVELAEVDGDSGGMVKRPPRIPVSVAAEMLGNKSHRWVRQLIADEELRADRPPGSRAWRVDPSSVEEYLMRDST